MSITKIWVDFCKTYYDNLTIIVKVGMPCHKCDCDFISFPFVVKAHCFYNLTTKNWADVHKMYYENLTIVVEVVTPCPKYDCDFLSLNFIVTSLLIASMNVVLHLT